CLFVKLLRCRKIPLTMSKFSEIPQTVRHLWMTMSVNVPPYLQCLSKHLLGLLKLVIPRIEPPKPTEDIRKFDTPSAPGLDSHIERIQVVILGIEDPFSPKLSSDFRRN